MTSKYGYVSPREFRMGNMLALLYKKKRSLGELSLLLHVTKASIRNYIRELNDGEPWPIVIECDRPSGFYRLSYPYREFMKKNK